MERPFPGKTTEQEISVEVCHQCGYMIDMGMCSFECPYDGEYERPKIIHAIYRRTDVFLRDEIVEQSLDDRVNEILSQEVVADEIPMSHEKTAFEKAFESGPQAVERYYDSLSKAHNGFSLDPFKVS